MEQLKNMKHQLTSIVQGELGHIESVDAKELGEVVDMIKDLSEAIYYCTVVEAMEEGTKDKELMMKMMSSQHTEEPASKYYTRPRMYQEDFDNGRMYYGGNSGDSSYYTSNNVGMNRQTIQDPKMGMSPSSRRMYMESKEMNHDTSMRMKELEQYMQDLSKDITEMIGNATPEEKVLLQKKLATLSTKVV